MTPRLFLLLFVAGLLVLGILAITCGDDGNDEDAIRNTILESITACNAGDSERYRELITATGPGCPPGAPNDLEVLSVTVVGDESTQDDIIDGVLDLLPEQGDEGNDVTDAVRDVAGVGSAAVAELILTDNEGEPNEFIVVLRKEDGRWLVQARSPTR